MTMTGVALEPVGPMPLETLIDIYKEQAQYLYEAGVDLFVVETMMSLAETRAAVIAIKETCDLPVMASMTFQEDGRTLYGTDPVTAVVVLQSIGADVIGVNCSTGPAQMLPVVRQMKEYAEVPILVKPNADCRSWWTGRLFILWKRRSLPLTVRPLWKLAPESSAAAAVPHRSILNGWQKQ